MKSLCAFLCACLLSLSASAKDAPSTTVLWPSPEKPAIRFTFGKFVKLSSLSTQNSYTVDVTAENLWNKPIPGASFEVYFFSEDNIRIGNGYIALNNVGVKETVRFTMPFGASGAKPVTLKLVATSVPKEFGPATAPKKIRVTVYSVPTGAKLKVDGEDAGETPKQVEIGVGKHALQFSAPGYHTGTYPLEVGPDDVSGGTVSFELGGLSHDTIELRDGTTLAGDVESMDATSVVVRVGGKMQSFERNQVKRMLLVERDADETAQAK
jgi:hypothetical protein